MATQVAMPKLGLTMINGKVVKWLVAEGDSVTKGQTIVQVTTEKIANVVEAPADGVVRKILVAEGATVPVLTPLAIIGSVDEDITEALKAASAAPSVSNIVAGASAPVAAARPVAAPVAAPAQAQPIHAAPSGDAVKISPAARQMAEEARLDLSTIVGSGPAGRILREDVEKAVAAKKTAKPAAKTQAPAADAVPVHAAPSNAAVVKASPAAKKLAEANGVDLTKVQGTGPDGRIMTEDVEKAIAAGTARAQAPAGPAAAASAALPTVDQTVAANDMRLIIARRMMESMTVAAQTTISRSVNVGELVKLRESLVRRLQREAGVKPTYTDLIVRAVALSLRRHPEINVSFDGQNVTTHAEVNIGVAVDLGDGLIVPVVRNAEALGLAQLSARIKGLAEMARRGALVPDDVVGNTFTVTNLGMYGVDAFTPIINQPESAILGVGRIADRPVVENGQVVPGKEMVLSLTHDHRVIDGAGAARFLDTVAGYLEAPYTLLGLGNAL